MITDKHSFVVEVKSDIPLSLAKLRVEELVPQSSVGLDTDNHSLLVVTNNNVDKLTRIEIENLMVTKKVSW